MAELPYDIILQIIMRLPLKYAARCSILNKHFHNCISTPKFVRDHHALLSSSSPRSSSNPIILHHTATKFTTINSPVQKSVTLADEDMILLDSCNGILLLYSRSSANYYIFNPFTGGLMFLNYHTNNVSHCGGLVVQIPSNNPSTTSFDFKLVELEAKKRGVRTRMRFRMFVPSGQTYLVMKEVYWDYEGSFSPLISRDYRPVYGHGCLHWLGKGATSIAAFDVESGGARIMGGPVKDATYLRTWFGFAQGSLQLIGIDYRNREQISVHTHNYVTHEWRMMHRILMPGCSSVGMILAPMFFDGMQNVFFHISEIGNYDMEEIYVYDLSVDEWNKRGQVEVLSYGMDQRYVEFVPTTARVSNVYVSNMLVQQQSTKKGLCFLALQRLLLDCDS